MAKKRGSPAPAKFKVGDRVRVKRGIRDTEYPDMPLGGWAGIISASDKDGMFTVRWSREILAAIHPVVKKRCDRDGMELEEYWLGEDDLEPDEGGPLGIEQPTEITTKPLSPRDQDDRVRMVFGLTSNDPLPAVDYEMLQRYQERLSKDLVFPFGARYTVETGPFSSRTIPVKVVGLGDPGEPMIDETYGIFREARQEGRLVTLPLGELEVNQGKPNRQLIADYSYWFWNWR
ncbi:MAG: calcium-binding protein [Pirellulales bacterium]|nr:calcium-binding protein [Pirellulales bacterium]